MSINWFSLKCNSRMWLRLYRIIKRYMDPLHIGCMVVQMNSSTVSSYSKLNGNFINGKILYASKCLVVNIETSIWHDDDILFNGPFRFRFMCSLFFISLDLLTYVREKFHKPHQYLSFRDLVYSLSKRFAFCKLFYQQTKSTAMPK